MDFEEMLIEFGLKRVDARIYLHLLKSGSQTQQKISDTSGILRQTVYESILRLENKGLVSKFTSGKTKLYSSVNPEVMLEQSRQKLENFKKELPELIKLRGIGASNHFSENFTGINGLKAMFDITLFSKTPILWFANEKAHIEIFKDFYWQNYAKKRSKRKVPIKLLIESNIKKSIWLTNINEKREVKRIESINKIISSFAVFDDKIILYSIEHGQPQGVLISNAQISSMFKIIFQEMWGRYR